MKSRRRFRVVLITAPNVSTARRIARAALKEKLIACANLIPNVESHYRWRGKLEKSSEVLMICKTTTKRAGVFQKLVHRLHPYDTPEFVEVEIVGGSQRYLDWLGVCCDSV